MGGLDEKTVHLPSPRCLGAGSNVDDLFRCAIGAMDPPRALVPAAGWGDSPPVGPITQSSPDPPKATPGNIVPEPVSGPTSQPQKGSIPQTTPQPSPPDNGPKAPNDPPRDPASDPPKGSSTTKEPSKALLLLLLSLNSLLQVHQMSTLRPAPISIQAAILVPNRQPRKVTQQQISQII